MPTALPVIFVSHGAPTFALEPGRTGPLLAAVGKRLPPVRAILVVSAHWETHGEVRVSSAPRPETIHDFGGFPRALYELSYAAAGHPALAQRTADLLQHAGIPARLDPTRGLDHGAWVPLMHMRPDADLPVFQVSLPAELTAAGCVVLGRALAPLREEGVLIVGSGSLTHNLYEFRRHDDGREPYVLEFSRWVQQAVETGDLASLVDYRKLAPHAARAHPSEDHFLPLLVAIGATTPAEPVAFIDGGVTYGVLAMDAYVIGELADAPVPA
jgi:4,5-DOPA dioxygenase extradiol